MYVKRLWLFGKKKINDLCTWYLSWFHDYIKQTGRYKKDNSCENDQHNHVMNEN